MTRIPALFEWMVVTIECRSDLRRIRRIGDGPLEIAWMELDTGNYGPSMVDRTVASLFGLTPSETKPQQWNVTLVPTLTVAGPVVVKDLVLDGNLGRDVLRHWQVTLDLANGRGWIRILG